MMARMNVWRAAVLAWTLALYGLWFFGDGSFSITTVVWLVGLIAMALIRVIVRA